MNGETLGVVRLCAYTCALRIISLKKISSNLVKPKIISSNFRLLRKVFRKIILLKIVIKNYN